MKTYMITAHHNGFIVTYPITASNALMAQIKMVHRFGHWGVRFNTITKMELLSK